MEATENRGQSENGSVRIFQSEIPVELADGQKRPRISLVCKITRKNTIQGASVDYLALPSS